MANNQPKWYIQTASPPSPFGGTTLQGVVGRFGHNAHTHPHTHTHARASTHYWAESAESEPTTSVWHGKYRERFWALEATLRNVSMYRSATR